jgi:hypothetical protein
LEGTEIFIEDTKSDNGQAGKNKGCVGPDVPARKDNAGVDNLSVPSEKYTLGRKRILDA